jgi:hypothetical protein
MGETRLSLIQINHDDAKAWLLPVSSASTTSRRSRGVVRLIVENDFACIDRRAGEEADDELAFLNPAMFC